MFLPCADLWSSSAQARQRSGSAPSSGASVQGVEGVALAFDILFALLVGHHGVQGVPTGAEGTFVIEVQPGHQDAGDPENRGVVVRSHYRLVG